MVGCCYCTTWEKMCNVFKIHYAIIHVVACKVFFWYKIVVWAKDDIASYADVLKVPLPSWFA